MAIVKSLQPPSKCRLPLTGSRVINSPGCPRSLNSSGFDSLLSRAGDETSSVYVGRHPGEVDDPRSVMAPAFEGRLKGFHDGHLSLELIGRKQSKKHQAVEAGTEIEIACLRGEGEPGSRAVKVWCRA